MALMTLSCGHGSVATHDIGERRIACSVPGCAAVDVVKAHVVTEIRYENCTICDTERQLLLDLVEAIEARA